MEKITLPGAAATVTNAIGLQLEALAASFLAVTYRFFTASQGFLMLS
jgi:hypothetical protein